jgi:hypothetical protein
MEWKVNNVDGQRDRHKKKANRHFLEFCKHASKFLQKGIHTRKKFSHYTFLQKKAGTE